MTVVEEIMQLVRARIEPNYMSAQDALECLEALVEEIKSEIDALKETMP